VQVTNIGGVYTVNSPPIDLDGRALSFDTAANLFISIDRPGWYFIQRTWTVAEALGIPACWFELSGESNALGPGGGHWSWIKGDFNTIALERRHMLYLQAAETFPYLVNSPLQHECDTHDGSFRISVSYLSGTDDT
jgi:hypothetical protein